MNTRCTTWVARCRSDDSRHVAAAAGADWITAPSHYTHDPQTGQRVDQYTPIGPFYTFARTDFMQSGYRHTASTMQAGLSVDHMHIVEEWGRPVRPYGEWQVPVPTLLGALPDCGDHRLPDWVAWVPVGRGPRWARWRRRQDRSGSATAGRRMGTTPTPPFARGHDYDGAAPDHAHDRSARRSRSDGYGPTTEG